MQSEVIDDILNIEAEAARIVAEAEKEAQEIVLEAQSSARKKIQTQIEAVRNEGNKEVELANKVLQEHIAAYEEERERIEKEGTKLDPETLSLMVNRVIQRISTTG